MNYSVQIPQFLLFTCDLVIEAETCCHLVTLNKINIPNTCCVSTCEYLLLICTQNFPGGCCPSAPIFSSNCHNTFLSKLQINTAPHLLPQLPDGPFQSSFCCNKLLNIQSFLHTSYALSQFWRKKYSLSEIFVFVTNFTAIKRTKRILQIRPSNLLTRPAIKVSLKSSMK